MEGGEVDVHLLVFCGWGGGGGGWGGGGGGGGGVGGGGGPSDGVDDPCVAMDLLWGCGEARENVERVGRGM